LVGDVLSDSDQRSVHAYRASKRHDEPDNIPQSMYFTNEEFPSTEEGKINIGSVVSGELYIFGELGYLRNVKLVED
jgi:hypothetical protein